MRRITNLKIDRKTTVWERDSYSVNATAIDALLLSMKTLSTNVVPYLVNESLGFDNADDNETLYDTSETMTKEENGGNTTIEIVADLETKEGNWDRAIVIWNNDSGLTDEFKQWANSQIVSKSVEINKIKL